MTFLEICERFGAEPRGGKAMVRCPGHDDRSPSLSIRAVEGKTQVRCFAGCGQDAVLGAVGLKWPDLYEQPFMRPSASDLAQKPARKPAKPAPGEDKEVLTALQTIRASQIEAKDVEWLWEPYFARGTFGLVDGAEGLGKTWLLLKKAADFTQDGLNVLLISAEDALSFVVKPRLENVGADCERVHIVTENFTLDADGITRLSFAMGVIEPSLCIIDPLFSRVGGIDLNKDNQIRSITDALNALAEKHECTIVGIRHIGKSKGFGDARNAGLNGVGWRAGARTAMLVGCDPNDESKRAFVQTKNNLAPIDKTPLGFEITPDGQFIWTGESDLTADKMLSFKESVPVEERGARGEAGKFLLHFLKDGPQKATVVFDNARSAGIAEATLRRAKSALGIKAIKGEFAGQWVWSLPEGDHEGDQSIKSDHLRTSCASKGSYDNTLHEGDQNSNSDHLRDHLRSEPAFRTCEINAAYHLCGHEKTNIENHST
jgi:DNA repair protein RadA/Sms